MAEQLGQAELVITVNDADALRKLGELKKQVADLEGQAGRQTTKTRTATAKASPAEVAQKRAERAAEQAANKRVSIQNRLNLLEAKGVEVTAFRLRAAKANEAAEQSQFDNARRINAQLSRALSIEENRLRVSAAQAAQLKRQEAATKGTASTVTKTAQKPTGVGFATTPEQILASRGGIQKGAASGITAREAATDKLTRLQNRLNILDAKGVNITNQRAALDQILQANKAGQLGTSQQLIRSLSRQLDIEENNLKVTNLRAAADKRRATAAANAAKAAKSGQLTPAADGIPAFIPLPKPSREERRRAQEAAKRRNDILSNALIGGAFPALFGQGLGASLGGAAGGAAGGAIGGQFGFGLSLVGTALGAQFDAALNKAKELAKALDNPIAQFSAIKENALLSSKGLEKNVEALIATGRQAEAAALIQEDLAKTFGNAQEVQNFVNETDKLNRAWTETSVTLAAFVAGPLAGLLGRLNEPIRGFNAAGRVARATAGLSPDQRAQVEQFTRRRQRELGVPGIAATDAQSLQLNLDILAEIERIQGRNNNALERAARNQKILTQSATTLVKLEDAIGRARIGGNKPLEDSITLSRELLTNYRERKNIDQQLTAKQIKAAQATELTGQSLAKDRTLRQDYLDSSRESLINATKELETTKQLSGLEGTRLEVAQRRIELSKAFNLRELRGQQLTDARTNASLNPGNENFRVLFQGALQSFVTAGVDFETKLRQASDYLKQAAKDAATNLTNALLNVGKLEADPGGLNRFLTRDEQFESSRRAILRLGGDGSKGPSQLESAITKATELLGLTRNQANERFQGLRDIVSGARQGRFASQEGFNTLSGFIQDTLTREQAVTGVGDAQKTLADITSLNVTVQKELSTAVKENTVALNAVFGKDWSVNLAVQGGEVAAYGDVISRNLTP